MKRTLGMLAVATALVFSAAALSNAEQRPVNLCLWDTIQLYPPADVVQGLRLSVYGVSTEVDGVDIGIVPRITGNFMGAQWGCVNLVEGDFTGYQDGFVNTAGTFLGWQTGAINITKGQFRGLQTGLFNSAGSVKGVQFAIVNMAESLKGLQIGILNINKTPNPLGMFPIVIWSF